MSKLIFGAVTLLMALISGAVFAVVKEFTDAPVFITLATILSAFLILKLPRIIINQNQKSKLAKATANGPNADKQSNNETWKYYLLAVCLLVVVSGFFINPPTELTLPYVLGFNLPFVLMVWLFFHFSFLRGKIFGRTGLSFFAILISTMTAIIIAHQTDATTKNNVVSDSRLHNGGDYKAAAKTQTQEDIDDVAQAKKLLKILLNETKKINSSYQTELKNIGWDSVTEATKGLQNSPHILSERLEIVNLNSDNNRNTHVMG